MKSMLPEVREKVAPFVADAKKEAQPFVHALSYCIVWLGWVAMLPLVYAGAWLGSISKKIKPELPKLPE